MCRTVPNKNKTLLVTVVKDPRNPREPVRNRETPRAGTDTPAPRAMCLCARMASPNGRSLVSRTFPVGGRKPHDSSSEAKSGRDKKKTKRTQLEVMIHIKQSQMPKADNNGRVHLPKVAVFEFCFKCPITEHNQ